MIIRENLSDTVANYLREHIASGRILPGTRLKQQEIAQTMNMSLIPVREAFRTLEREGLITLLPNKGAEVRTLSSVEARQIFELRLILERGAMALAFHRVTEAALDQALKIIEAMDLVEDSETLSKLNNDFHQCLYGACDNPMLLEAISKHYQNTDRYMRVYLHDAKSNQYSQDIHRSLLGAYFTKDLELADHLLEIHMKTAMNALIETLKTEGEPL